jgi:hypothetical protein
MKWRIKVLVVAVLFLAGVALAQSDRATINGVVTDASGAVVPGVEVKARNLDTNDVQRVVTNESGLYYVRNLPIGTYTLTFSKPGFKSLERKGLTLQVSQIAEIDVVLAVGTTSETVLVNEATPLLQTQTAAVSTNLTNDAVTELPLNVQGGRNLSSFIFSYVPGVEGSDYDSHINGSLSKTKEVMIDGTSGVAQLGGFISESQPPMEAVREFEAETSGIRSDEGRTGGGVFRYEMKSGTNQYHGSAFGFLHNAVLDANSAANKLSMTTDPTRAYLYVRPSDSLSDWGVSVGGPILKDKLFFYGAYERYMFSNWGLGGQGGTVPTTAMLNGDLSALLNTSVNYGQDGAGNTIYQGAIFDPTTGNVFVNNQIPTTRFSAASQPIVALYKKYYQPESANRQNNAMPATALPWQHNNEVSAKIDYNRSDRHHINGSYIYMAEPRILADQGGIWSPNALDGGPLANAYNHNTHAPAVRLSDSYTFTPNVLQTFRFTLNRFYNPSVAVSQAGNWPRTLGLGAYTGNFPKIGFNGSNYANAWNVSGLGSQFNDFYAANTIIFNDEVSWVKGHHSFKFGGEFRAMQFNSHPDTGVVNVTFDPAQTGNPTASYSQNVGSSWASFLLGDVNSASVGTPIAVYGRRKALSLYASDDFKVTSKLVLNIDLRWDFNSRYKEKYGHWSEFDPTLIDPVNGAKGALSFLTSGDQSFEKRQAWLNFAPHIGAAYQLTPRTVVRGSFAIFYVPLNLNTWGAVPYSFNPGYGYDNEIRPTGQRAAAFNWDSGYPGQPVAVGKDPSFTKWGMVTIDPHALLPGNTQQWNVGVQREIAKNTKVEVSVIGSHSYHLQSGFLAGNQPKPADFQALIARGGPGALWPWVSDPASAAAAGVPYPYPGFAGNAWMAITPYPQVAATWGPQFVVGDPLGNANYKAMQISVTKRTSHGLAVQGSYVLSATHGNTDTAFEELWWTGSIQNLYDLQQERNGISSFDTTHVIKGYVIYDLPVGRHRALLSHANSVVDAVAGGWTLNFGYHYSSGTPVSLHSTNWYPGFNSVYVNLKPGCNLTTGVQALNQAYLNTSCFSNPAFGQLGNGGNFLSDVRYPWLHSEDLGILKNFVFGPAERFHLTARGEFFNVFNRSRVDNLITNLNDPRFGQFIGRGGIGPRIGQVGLRLTF